MSPRSPAKGEARRAKGDQAAAFATPLPLSSAPPPLDSSEAGGKEIEFHRAGGRADQHDEGHSASEKPGLL
jgi:hypothetical protein